MINLGELQVLEAWHDNDPTKKAEATLGEEQIQLSDGEMAIIPEMIPHSIRNKGNETLKCIGFFSKPMVTSTFNEVVQPIGAKSFGPPVQE